MRRKSFSNLSIFFAYIALSTLPFPAFATDTNAPGSIGIRIAQIPAAIADEPFADVYIISRIQPSNSLVQRLEVFNTSNQEFEVNLYPGAATYLDGKFSVVDGRGSNRLTAWTKLSPNQLSVKAGESKTFQMTISVPIDAISQQQFGVIWAEVQGAPNSSGVTTSSRVGIRMYIPVGGAPNISISGKSINPNPNQIVVKGSGGMRYSLQIVYTLLASNICFFILFLFYYRRSRSENRARRRNDKREEAEWRSEKIRREEIARRTGR